MRSSKIGLLVLPLLLAQPAMGVAAKPPDTAVLQPSSQWEINYEEHSCTLQRGFGDEQHRVFLGLDDYSLGDGMRATVVTSAFGRVNGSATVGFQPGAQVPASLVATAKFPEGRSGIIFDLSADLSAKIDHSADQSAGASSPVSDATRNAREQSLTGLFVGGAFDTDLLLVTGPMNEAMNALRKCDEDLERHLGLDPQALKTVINVATPKNQMAWARKVQDIYPESALRANESARVFFRLIIDAQGKVSDCYARPEGHSPEFGQSACSVFKAAATFNPARDVNGNPIASIYHLGVSWDVF